MNGLWHPYRIICPCALRALPVAKERAEDIARLRIDLRQRSGCVSRWQNSSHHRLQSPESARINLTLLRATRHMFKLHAALQTRANGRFGGRT